MEYEWTEWMDVPMGVPCPVKVGEIVETEFEQTSGIEPRKGGVTLKVTKGFQDKWTKASMQEGTSHILSWKYRVKKPNTKKWLESLETEPEEVS